MILAFGNSLQSMESRVGHDRSRAGVDKAQTGKSSQSRLSRAGNINAEGWC